ncbi:MAG: hypothetical protein FWE33_01735 [Defluviitaleaceae bacterium]|nr:hypothetical protein [Defluviitaleaceae bacterium]
MSLNEVKEIICRGEHCLHAVQFDLHEIAKNREIAGGIYPRRGSRNRQENVGGKQNRAYDVTAVSVLLRLGRDGAIAEKMSKDFYEAMAGKNFTLEDKSGFVKVIYDNPIWLGADSRGVFEYVIDVDFIS